MNPANATPMIQQYLAIKEAYPDALLFYRMGDFYEMFFEDAGIAARLLDITLTSRNKKDKRPVPMCGVPYRAAKTYIARLVEKGYKVAICDQVEDPALAKGLVKRDVVRVVTPGMILENDLLDEKSNNYLFSAFSENGAAGISCLDISTGTFKLTQTDDLQAVREEVLRIDPSEIILPEALKNSPLDHMLTGALRGKPVSYLDDRAFDYAGSRKRLLQTLGTVSLEGFGCERLKAGVCAAGAILHYVKDTQKQQLHHLDTIETYALTDHLLLDDLAGRNLELEKNIRSGSPKGSLLNIIDRTISPMGSRLLRQWMRYPHVRREPIMARYDAVAEALDKLTVCRAVREQLKSVYDLERLRGKISMQHANARDLTALKQSLATLPDIKNALTQFESSALGRPEALPLFSGLVDLIERAVREDAPPTLQEGGIIREGFNPDLDELIRISRDGKGYLMDLEAREREATGIQALKVRYNKVFGYYIEVPRSRIQSVPPHYVRKQTLVNAERYINEDLKRFEAKVLGAEDERASLEYRLFKDVESRVVARSGEIQRAAAFLARLDCLLALAVAADDNNYVRPEINDDGLIIIEDGRHPVVEKMISGERFVPNSLRLDNQENQVLIITGPNMAGKSTVLRQVALTVIMAQMGSFVPARRASVCLSDRIFTRVGALDDLSQGQSTFMVEMQETANILNNATHNSLIILDEIGRGTSTFDGMSIAWAVAEYLHDFKGRGVKTLFATHYHELTDLAQQKPRIRNFNIVVKEWNDEIIFLRKLVEGGTNRSYGIQVARLAGVPGKVLKRARHILAGIEKNADTLRETVGAATDSRMGLNQPVQLELFTRKTHWVVDAIKKQDVSHMTPIEALYFLNEVQEKIRGKTADKPEIASTK